MANRESCGMQVLNWLAGLLLGAGKGLEEHSAVKELTQVDTLEATLADASEQLYLIFKHSTTCPISASAYRRVEDYLAQAGDTAPPIYLVKVIESRPVSNAVANYFGVRHESPQLLLVCKGKVRWHASHGAITAESIAAAVTSTEC